MEIESSNRPAHERLREQSIFRSSMIEIGVFRAGPRSGLFGWQAPPGHYAIAFPQTSVRIRPTHAPAFVTDRSLVTLYEPDDTYERSLVDPAGDLCTFLSPAPSVARDFAARAGITTGGVRLFRSAFEYCPADTFRRHRRLVRRLMSRSETPSTEWVEEEALAILDGIAEHAARRAPEAGVSAASRRSATRAREYLACHYAEAPSLERVAQVAGCSPYHLCRTFRHLFGTTVHRYCTTLALRAAHDRITDSGQRLLDIALELGFTSHSHMTAAFRQEFGVPPSSLRTAAAVPVP